MKNLATLTPRDLARRQNFLNASEVPAITGTHPKFNLADVVEWKNTELASAPTSEVQKWGQRLEDDILDYTRDELQEYLERPELRITKQGCRRVHPNGIMACTLDARIVGRDEAIEAKTSNVIHSFADLSQWGDESWTDAVPPHVLDQVLAQLACCPELQRIWVVLWAGRHVPVIYCVERANHRERIAWIEHLCCDVWERYIIPNVKPEMAPNIETMKRDLTPRVEGPVAVLDDATLEKFKALGEQIRDLTAQKDDLDALIKRAMVGFVVGRSPKGHTAQMTSYNRKGYTVEPKSITKMNVSLSLV